MAVALPQTRDLDVCVLSQAGARDLDVVPLLRYLQSVHPSAIVLMGRYWSDHLRKVSAFGDSLLADHVERLRRGGVRVYVLDPRQRRSARIGLPRGQHVELRRELRLRVGGQWVWFGDRSAFRSPVRRAVAWARSIGRDGTAEADLLAEVSRGIAAEAERLDAVVVADRRPSLRTVGREGATACTLASPGDWRDGHRALELLFGRWALRSAGGLAPEGVGRVDRERLRFGPLLAPTPVTGGK